MDRKNDPHSTDWILISKLIALDAQLAKWREEIKLVMEVTASQNVDGIAAYYWTSAETGMKRMRTFMQSLEQARFAAQLGTPIQPGQLKPRSTAKKQAIAQDRQRNLDRVAEAKASVKKKKKPE